MTRRAWILFVISALFLPDANAGQTKSIAIVERLEKGNPYLTYRIKEDYERAVEMALDSFRRGEWGRPGFDPEVKYWFKETDELGSIGIVKEVARSKALAAVGFAFANQAILAAKAASEAGFLLVSPTASTDRFAQPSLGKTFGMSPSHVASQSARLIKEKFKGRKVFLISAGDKSNQREYASLLKAALEDRVDEITYVSDTLPLPHIIEKLRPHSKNLVVVLAGYAHEAVKIPLALQKSGVEATYLVSPQWAYAEPYLNDNIGDSSFDLYCVSDFHAFTSNDERELKSLSREEDIRRYVAKNTAFQASFARKFKSPPQGLSYAVYDAVSILLTSMNNPNIQSRALLAGKVDALGRHVGVNAVYRFEDREVRKSSLLLRWQGRRFTVAGLHGI